MSEPMTMAKSALKKARKQLLAKREEIDRALEAIDAVLGTKTPRVKRKPARPARRKTNNKRRRKMTKAQREEISKRMKRYWAKRRREGKK